MLRFPAMNCRATLKRPAGTKAEIISLISIATCVCEQQLLRRRKIEPFHHIAQAEARHAEFFGRARNIPVIFYQHVADDGLLGFVQQLRQRFMRRVRD